ncbi:hypothetical protein [Brevibacterium sp. FME17]|uniref:hypothetical protein n=1 Tax=Brevibacterium sp. FME17 TaxID=2742606 RepID=UPI0018681781|nr:hypothetical protein [Brevibacterium sp. FME17]
MHTSTLLKTPEFTFAGKSRTIGLDSIFPDFTSQDRVGIVATSPGDSLRAAPLLLSAIGAFYEELWDSEDDFYLYPDFFVFHVGTLTGYHSPFDIWPQSKEVVVEHDPQSLLAAINDRGITRLVLPDAHGGDGVLMEHAVQLAARRVRSIVRHAPADADPMWTVTPSLAAAKMIRRCARVSAPILGEELTSSWTEDPGAAQGYSPVDFSGLLSWLCTIGTTHASMGFSSEYRAAASVTDAILARDIHEVRRDDIEPHP